MIGGLTGSPAGELDRARARRRRCRARRSARAAGLVEQLGEALVDPAEDVSGPSRDVQVERALGQRRARRGR